MLFQKRILFKNPDENFDYMIKTLDPGLTADLKDEVSP